MHNKITALKLISIGLLTSFWISCSAIPLQVTNLYRASIQPIPHDVTEQIKEYSWWPRCPVKIEQLAYVTLNHWGFDNRPHQGVLIVNRRVAKEVVAIFKDLFLARFPIESIKPRHFFADRIFALLLSDSTASFMCRKMVGNSNRYSLHSYGTAIDINPVQNPYIKGNLVIPWFGLMYVNRNHNAKGMILANDIVVRSFAKHGWRWGGNWKTRKDYMHFEKKL